MSFYPQLISLYKLLARQSIYSFLRNEIVAMPVSARVLIVGAGGECEVLLRQIGRSKGLQFESIDIDPARKPTNVGDVHSYCFQSDTFDAIVIAEVLEHLSEPRQAITNLTSALKSGGKIIITVPFIFPIHDQPRDYFRYTIFGLKDLLRDFRDLEIIKKDNWPESTFISLSRLIFSPKKQNVFLGVVFLFLYLLLFPVLKVMGSLFADDSITSGYLISAVKP